MSVCQSCGEPLAPSNGPRPRKWCSERCRKTQYTERVPCVDCGAPTSSGPRNGYNHSRCSACAMWQEQEAWRPYREMIEEMWAEGMTSRQIGEAVGWTTKNPGCMISLLRSRGYNLPYRYGPERIAEVVKNGDSMRKARAARKAAA